MRSKTEVKSSQPRGGRGAATLSRIIKMTYEQSLPKDVNAAFGALSENSQSNLALLTNLKQWNLLIIVIAVFRPAGESSKKLQC